MKIHNQIEDLVIDTVSEIFDEESKEAENRYCTCDQCRLDVACYVLNRTKPRYVISGRGFAHMEADYRERLQEKADLIALIQSGIKTVSRTKRPYFSHNGILRSEQAPEGPWFNFPVIKGRVFDGSTFEPVHGIDVLLVSGDATVPMRDAKWQNPYSLVPNVSGVYLFWPRPEPAKSAGMTRSFPLAVTVQPENYEPLVHHFVLELTSDEHFVDAPHGNLFHVVDDLYLFEASSG